MTTPWPLLAKEDLQWILVETFCQQKLNSISFWFNRNLTTSFSKWAKNTLNLSCLKYTGLHTTNLQSFNSLVWQQTIFLGTFWNFLLFSTHFCQPSKYFNRVSSNHCKGKPSSWSTIKINYLEPLIIFIIKWTKIWLSLYFVLINRTCIAYIKEFIKHLTEFLCLCSILSGLLQVS